MQKLSGIHFYINIENFNSIILDEEKRTRGVTHALHALDTFFTSIESFGKRQSEKLVVEKITGSRLHLYVVDSLVPAYQVVATVSAYAYKLSKFIHTDIPKYDSLQAFIINIGMAFGQFYDFEFTDEKGYTELTTIGYAANFAAKLQSLAGQNKIGISEDIYCALPEDEKRLYKRIDEPSIKKYNQDRYYSGLLVSLASRKTVSDDDLLAAKNYANKVKLSKIDFSEVRTRLNFANLSKTQCKKLEGIPVFADVRGFTSKFEEDDSNLEEMAQKTLSILNSMYSVSSICGGVHVQFQGDRECSLYHNTPSIEVDGKTVPEQMCFKNAVLAAMRMIDAVKPYSVHIGVGEDYGILFATKLGARGEKDNIILGETVITADAMEDKHAGEDEIAISAEVYKGLKDEDSSLADKFKWTGSCYIASIGYHEYQNLVAFQRQSANTTQNKYNGAWGVLE